MSHGAALDQVCRMLATPAHHLEDMNLLELFLQRHDGEAFAELVRRHGPLVLGVCRRVLRDRHDADDVFQATFLVLARKADSIRKRQSLPSWLHGVAYRLALKNWADLRRRRDHEQRFRDDRVTTDEDVDRREIRSVLDEELRRLPERQRVPLILCYAEGKSQQEAARELGWSRGTLKRRLERGRDLLRARLTRRGLALSGGAAVGLTPTDLLAGVPAPLAASAVKLATLMTAPEALGAGALSAKVTLLADGLIRSMFLGKMKTAAAVLLLLGLLGVGAGVVGRQTLGSDNAAAPLPAESPTTAAQPPATRLDSDGQPLPQETLARLGSTRLKHSGWVGFLGFTPDGKTLVSKGHDGVRTWDVATGRLLRRFQPRPGDWLGAALSPDGRRIATTFIVGTESNGITIWDVQRGELVRNIVAGITCSPTTCFSPDGTLLASARFQSATHFDLWDAATGKRLRSWDADKDTQLFAPLLFTPDGKTLLSAHTDRTVRSWDAATAKELGRVNVAPDDPVKMALSPDGKLLAVLTEKLIQPGQFEHRLRFVDMASGKEVRRLTVTGEGKQSGKFGALAFSPDGVSLFGALGDSVFVWDPATGKERRRFSEGLDRSLALAVSPDGTTLAAAVRQTSIHLYDLKKNQERFPTAGHQSELFQVALPLNGRAGVTSAREYGMLIWDPVSGRERRRLDVKGSTFTLAADDRTLVAQDGDKSVRFWDLNAGKELRNLTLGEPFFRVALSPDGKTLAARSYRRNVIRLHDAATGKSRLEWPMEEGWEGMTFSPDGKRLIAWSSAHIVHVWDVATSREVRSFPFQPTGKVPMMKLGQGQLGGVRYEARVSPDGRWIAYVSLQRLLVLDLETGQVVRRLEGLPVGMTAPAFSPDGRTLAWTDRRTPTVHLLELATGRERHAFTSAGGWVRALAFAADGKKLIAGTSDTTALVWDLTGRLAAGAVWDKPLSAVELTAAWSDLTGADAARAYHTTRRLAAAPAQAIPFLRTRLRPVTPADTKQVARWIADLDSDDFDTRERAAHALEKLDDDVSGLYRQILAGEPSAEVKRRVEELLDKAARARMNPSPEGLRILRALEVLELAGTAEARQVLETLAQGAPDAPLTVQAGAALRRLGR